MKIFEIIGIFICLLVLFVVLVLSSVGCWAWRTAAGTVQRQVNPDAIIQNSEWFTQQYHDIRACELKIQDARLVIDSFRKDNGPSSSWHFDQREEYTRLHENHQALVSYRHNLIADYNAKAGMISRNLWKSPTLPQHIEE